MLKFFRIPFATSGDKTAVPDAVDVNGFVSYTAGYGFDYQRQKTDPAAKNIERDKMNEIFFDITTALAELQSQGIPDFITSALNGGAAYSYGQYAVVRYSGDLYISLVAANTALPSDATKWALLPTPARLQAAFNSSAVAGGTADAITGAFTPAITSLPAAPGTLSLFVRAGAANATTTPTFKADGTAAKTIVKGNNLPLAAGDIAGAGMWLELQYDATLDKWVLQNPATGVTVISGAAVQGAFKNLAISATGLAATVTVTCDELVLGDGAGTYATERNISGAITTTNTGANGLDTGTLAASTWYSIWRIGKTDGTRAFLFSLSATAPTMPSGYTLKARIGWFYTDATVNKYPFAFKQTGRSAQWVCIGGVPLRTMASGIAGNTTTPTYVAVGTANFAPPTAGKIKVLVNCPNNAGQVIVAPSNAYGPRASTGNVPWFALNGNSDTYGGIYSAVLDMVLESSNIYWASSGSANLLQAAGWEDNI